MVTSRDRTLVKRSRRILEITDHFMPSVVVRKRGELDAGGPWEQYIRFLKSHHASTLPKFANGVTGLARGLESCDADLNWN